MRGSVGPVHVIQLPVSLRLDTRSCVCVHDQGAHENYQEHVQEAFKYTFKYTHKSQSD